MIRTHARYTRHALGAFLSTQSLSKVVLRKRELLLALSIGLTGLCFAGTAAANTSAATSGGTPGTSPASYTVRMTAAPSKLTGVSVTPKGHRADVKLVFEGQVPALRAHYSHPTHAFPGELVVTIPEGSAHSPPHGSLVKVANKASSVIDGGIAVNTDGGLRLYLDDSSSQQGGSHLEVLGAVAQGNTLTLHVARMSGEPVDGGRWQYHPPKEQRRIVSVKPSHGSVAAGSSRNTATVRPATATQNPQNAASSSVAANAPATNTPTKEVRFVTPSYDPAHNAPLSRTQKKVIAPSVTASRRVPNGVARVVGLTVLPTKGGAGELVIPMADGNPEPKVSTQENEVSVTLPAAVDPRILSQYGRGVDVSDLNVPFTHVRANHTAGNGTTISLTLRDGLDGRHDVVVSTYDINNTLVLEVERARQVAATPKSLSKKDKNAYSGKRTSLDFQNIPVRSVLQVLSNVAGVNMVASDDVQGNITLRLKNVPWDKALDVILRAKGLGMRKYGNIIWIAPQGDLSSYEQKLAAARSKEANSAPLETSYLRLSYAKAQDVAKLLTTGSLSGGGKKDTNHGFLSPRGSLSFDKRTNTLLINDTALQTQRIRDLVKILDRPVRQVLIEARVVIASNDFARELGAKFGINAIGNIGDNDLNFGGKIGQNDSVYSQNGDGKYSTGGFNFNTPGSLTSGTMALGIMGHNYALGLELDASQQDGTSETISSPRVITANQQEAVIRQGQEIGYVTYQNSSSGGAGTGTATVQFKDAVLELKATPTITADGRIYLAVDVKKDNLDSYLTVPGSGQVPIINTQEVNTTVLLNDGQTVVLGGIYEVDKSDKVVKVPGLGSIPILGALFRHHQHTNNKAELLIFVTPRILDNGVEPISGKAFSDQSTPLPDAVAPKPLPAPPVADTHNS